jgi:hypothetical protein
MSAVRPICPKEVEMTDQQLEEFDKDESEDVEAHRRRAAANDEPKEADETDDDEVEAHRRRA